MEEITVRHIAFDLSEKFDPVFIEGDPEMSYFMIGLSMILPYLEPYLIQNSVCAQKHIKDEDLRHDMKQFCGQEGQHYRQHKHFNKKIKSMGYPGLAQFEDTVAEDYKRFTKNRSLKFNLAYAEGFESLTFPIALYMHKTGMLDQMTGTLGDIYTWHVSEEIEHRTVAFDAYHHLYGGYFYRLAVGLFAQYHLVKFMLKCTRYMLKTDGKTTLERFGGKAERRRRVWKWIKLVGPHLWPNLRKTYLPNYSPRKIAVSKEIHSLLASYTHRAFKLS